MIIKDFYIALLFINTKDDNRHTIQAITFQSCRQKVTMRSVLLFLFMVIFGSCQRNQTKIHPTVENISESVYASGVVKSKDQYQSQDHDPRHT